MSIAHASTIAKDSLFCESQRAMKKLEDDLTGPEAMNASLYEIEEMMRVQGRELRVRRDRADQGGP